MQYLNLGDYRVKFIENFISGVELLELTEEDIISLGVSAIGHRKKLLTRIKELNKRGNGEYNEKESISDENSDHSLERTSSDNNSSNNNNNNNNSIVFSFFFFNLF